MSAESVQYADKIILETLEKGLSHPDTKDNPIVESRLNLFGYWEGRTYYLNERGMDYAMNGCSRGIIEQIENRKRIDTLLIKIQSFSAKRQNISFWLSIIATVASIIGIFT